MKLLSYFLRKIKRLTASSIFSRISRRMVTPQGVYRSIENLNNILDEKYSIKEIIPECQVQFSCVSKHLDIDESSPALTVSKTIKYPKKAVYEIPNGRVFGSSGAIITNSNYLIGDLSIDFGLLPHSGDPKFHSIFNFNSLPYPNYYHGSVFSLIAPAGTSNYFHWMIDILPRFSFLQRGGYLLSDIDYFLLESTQTAFVQESLDALEIPVEKVISLTEKKHIQADILICTSSPSITNQGRLPIPTWIPQFIKHSFLDAPPVNTKSLPKLIWISRADSSKRSLVNEDEVLQVLEPLGFKDVILTKLSIKEQALLFNNASVIISPHGAGLTNLVFCKPGTKVIEIFLPLDVNGRWSGIGDYCYLSNQLNLSYFYMLSDEVSKFQGKVNWNDRKMVINLQKLLKVLQLVELI